MLQSYDPNLTVKQALALYYAENKFGEDGGYSSDWVDFKLGPIPMPFPNTAARKKALPYHDMHHILTGYRTTTVGEFEISAWEIGAGCKNFWAAWQLNLGGAFAGILSIPRRTWRAFIRGRRTQSLYGMPPEELLGLTVKEARERCGFADDETYASTLSDIPLFLLMLLAGGVTGIFTSVFILAFIPFGLYFGMKRKKMEQSKKAEASVAA